MSVLPRNKALTDNSASLRANQTKEERHLWFDFLRSYPIRFNRQRVIGNYIVDFYCPRAKLVIELDGGQHYEAEGLAHDAKRTHDLESLHLHILRFSNLDISRNFYGVCTTIDEEVRARTSP